MNLPKVSTRTVVQDILSFNGQDADEMRYAASSSDLRTVGCVSSGLRLSCHAKATLSEQIAAGIGRRSAGGLQARRPQDCQRPDGGLTPGSFSVRVVSVSSRLIKPGVWLAASLLARVRLSRWGRLPMFLNPSRVCRWMPLVRAQSVVTPFSGLSRVPATETGKPTNSSLSVRLHMACVSVALDREVLSLVSLRPVCLGGGFGGR